MFEILVEAFEAAAIVLLVVAFAGLFSWAGATMGLLDTIAHLLMGISDNEWVVLLLINLLRFIGGMRIDTVSIFYLFLSIFMPISSAWPFPGAIPYWEGGGMGTFCSYATAGCSLLADEKWLRTAMQRQLDRLNQVIRL